MREIVVIGGGAAGMMAAITAATKGGKVTILEQKERVGKKILSTGNGRCNFTNIQQDPACYRSENLEFPWGIIEQFPAQETIAFFLQLGIYSKNKNGYMYPYSEQASAILDVLRLELERLHIEILTEVKCEEIVPKRDGFLLLTSQGKIRAKRVILAAGSKAAPVTGSDGSGKKKKKKLGHQILPVLPALVQLRCKENFYKGIAGVRIQGEVSLLVDGVCVAKDKGEIQLTGYGISGIPVFQVSRFAAIGLWKKKEVTAVLNFMPDFTKSQFLAFLKNRVSMRPEKTMEDFLTGIFHKKLSTLWLKMCRIQKEQVVSTLSEIQLESLAHLIQNFSVCVESTNSYEQAQICCGGVSTREVNPKTLESLYVSGLYFAGEILDVDGMCGGYNLQWAWSSGYVAGREAALK